MRKLSLFILFIFSAAALYGYSSGPPDNTAGNPPDNQYCTACHSSFGLNSGTGTLIIEGLPENGFVPETNYSLTVTLNDPNMMRGGFELTIIYDSGVSYLMGGAIEITDPVNTQLSDNAGDNPDFIKHTSAGTHAGSPGPVSWTFDWVAPSALADMVTFYVAGNAANNNNDTNGDYIYAITEEVSQAIPPEPPVVSDIPDQTITAGESFAPINLDDYVTDPDTPDDQITWTYSGNVDLTVEIVDRVAQITPPNASWTGMETITFTAADPDLLEDSDDAMFEVQAAGVITRNLTDIPMDFALHQNFPNPFNAGTAIDFNLPIRTKVQLNIYDLKGRLVLAALNEELPAGVYSVNIDFASVPSGIYLYTINTGAFSACKKMVMLK